MAAFGCFLYMLLCALVLLCQASTTIGSSLSDLAHSDTASRTFHNLSLSSSKGGHALCVSGQVSVTASATNQKFTIQPPANQFAATELIQELLQINSTLVPANTAGVQTISGTYDLAVQLCYPANVTSASQVSTVQILTHGVGLDKSYWDIAPSNSYVDAAACAGYATLAYDRLGVGASQHPDPINVLQSSLEVELLHQLIKALHDGSIGLQKFEKVVCTAHSFGSIIQAGHDTKYPDECAAVLATGISDTIEYLSDTQLANNPAIANTVNATKFGSLSNAYFINPTMISVQQPFFRYPFFDIAVFEKVFESRATYSLGELFTLPLIFTAAPNYKGPVDVVDGFNDFSFCLGDCSKPGNRAQAYRTAFYPAASQSDSYLVPDTGHVINAHKNAGLAFSQMISFLKSNGL
ncbi:MAG: hypothetical protein Q9159_005291 [Coniocarpon cinnabarinum]